MNLTKVQLTPLQKKKLEKALNNATDFSVKLNPSQLSGNDLVNIGKVMRNKLDKNRTIGKGMVIKMSSKQIQDLKKNIMKKGGNVDITEDVKDTTEIVGNNIHPAFMIIKGLDTFMREVGMYDEIKQLINNLGTEFSFMIKNPEYNRYKNIYVNRIPKLIMIHGKIMNKINFIMNKPKTKARVNRLKFKANKVALKVKMLLSRLPKLIEFINARNDRAMGKVAVELERFADDGDKEGDDLDLDLESFDGGIISKPTAVVLKKTKGVGLQVDRGYGLQVGRGCDCGGSGLQVDTGSGLQVEAYRGRGHPKKKI